MFTVYRYHAGMRPRQHVAEFQRADLACVYAETLAGSLARTEQARWESAVAQGKPYVPGPVRAYAVDPLGSLGYFPIPTPSPTTPSPTTQPAPARHRARGRARVHHGPARHAA